jgi:hypothetical protein
MRLIFTLFLFTIYSFSFSQISLSGTSSTTPAANNGPAIIVDDALAITGATTLDGARVSISNNFAAGDALTYTGALPAGVVAGFNASTGILSFTGNATAVQYQALLRTVTFRTTSSSPSQRTVLFNLGKAISFTGNNHFYEYISGSYNWTAAKADAATRTLYGLQGYLVTITSQAENDFISQKLVADGWIGASDNLSQINNAAGFTYLFQFLATGNFYWITGPEKGLRFSTGLNTPSAVSSRYMNWAAGEPNNYDNNSEWYAEINSTGGGGKWNDLPIGNTQGYIVEYGGMPGDPSVDPVHSRKIRMISTQLISTPGVAPYELQADGALVDPAILVYSGNNITNAHVNISGNFKAGDALTHGTLPAGITSSYNSATGLLAFAGTASAAVWQTVFRSVRFSSSSDVIVNRDVTFSLGNLVAFSNGHFYEFIATSSNWPTAKANAAARTYSGLQGYLATITSQAENDFIKGKISTDAWIGASDSYTQINLATGATTYANQTAAEGKWYWVTGPEGEIGTQFSNNNAPSTVAVGSSYMNWNTGEPNNAGTEHYGEIYNGGANPGRWNDLGSASLGYVVEYGGLAGDPSIFLSANRTLLITTILPVRGLKFTANKRSEAVQLKWSTETETTADHFDVLHSTDGNRYRFIGRVSAAGNSTTAQHYQWLHEQPANGTNFYRLQQFDADGRSAFSEIRRVNNSTFKLQLLPNPATSVITISRLGSAKASLRITNTNGQLVFNTSLTQNSQSINIESLAPGMYIASIEENSVPVHIRFIKN